MNKVKCVQCNQDVDTVEIQISVLKNLQKPFVRKINTSLGKATICQCPNCKYVAIWVTNVNVLPQDIAKGFNKLIDKINLVTKQYQTSLDKNKDK